VHNSQLCQLNWDERSNKFLLLSSISPSTRFVKSMANIWRNWAPLKVILFFWQALISWLPTIANLLIRGIIQEEEAAWCLACALARESENHLLALCPSAWVMWSTVHRWFGLISILPYSIFSSLEWFLFIGNVSKVFKVCWWHDMPSFGCFGIRGMKEFSRQRSESRRFLKRYKLFHGNGFYKNKVDSNVYFINGVYHLIV
jgi:hypothetical protein